MSKVEQINKTTFWKPRKISYHHQFHISPRTSFLRRNFCRQVRLAAKISGIHWWYDSNSHAAEVTAGDPFKRSGVGVAEKWRIHIGYKLYIVYLHIYIFISTYIHWHTYILYPPWNYNICSTWKRMFPFSFTEWRRCFLASLRPPQNHRFSTRACRIHFDCLTKMDHGMKIFICIARIWSIPGFRISNIFVRMFQSLIFLEGLRRRAPVGAGYYNTNFHNAYLEIAQAWCFRSKQNGQVGKSPNKRIESAENFPWSWEQTNESDMWYDLTLKLDFNIVW